MTHPTVKVYSTQEPTNGNASILMFRLRTTQYNPSTGNTDTTSPRPADFTQAYWSPLQVQQRPDLTHYIKLDELAKALENTDAT